VLGQFFRELLVQAGSSPAVLVGLTSILFWVVACQRQPQPEWQWTRAEAGLPRQAITLSLAVEPNQPDRLWSGFYAVPRLASSQDRGESWRIDEAGPNRSQDRGESWRINEAGPNPVFDLLPAAHSRAVWAATRAGLRHSPDSGLSWQPVTGELPPAAVFAVAADNGGRLYL